MESEMYSNTSCMEVKTPCHTYLLSGQRHMGQKSAQHISTLGLRHCQCCLILLQDDGRGQNGQRERRAD